MNFHIGKTPFMILSSSATIVIILRRKVPVRATKAEYSEELVINRQNESIVNKTINAIASCMCFLCW